MDAVKMEGGGARRVEAARAIADAGVAVMVRHGGWGRVGRANQAAPVCVHTRGPARTCRRRRPNAIRRGSRVLGRGGRSSSEAAGTYATRGASVTNVPKGAAQRRMSDTAARR